MNDFGNPVVLEPTYNQGKIIIRDGINHDKSSGSCLWRHKWSLLPKNDFGYWDFNNIWFCNIDEKWYKGCWLVWYKDEECKKCGSSKSYWKYYI